MAVASGGASRYLTYDPTTQKFTLPPEQAMVFAIEDSPVYLNGAFETMAAVLGNQEKVKPAFKTGHGVAQGDQSTCMFCAVARFFARLPEPSGRRVAAGARRRRRQVERGAKVADVGCGHGWSTVFMAKAFPNSEFVGYDFHPRVDQKRASATEHGVTNATSQVGSAKDYASTNLDLVTFFDCLRRGRPGRRGGASTAPEAGQVVDDRRTDGRRPSRGQSEPGRTALLRGLDR